MHALRIYIYIYTYLAEAYASVSIGIYIYNIYLYINVYYIDTYTSHSSHIGIYSSNIVQTQRILVNSKATRSSMKVLRGWNQMLQIFFAKRSGTMHAPVLGSTCMCPPSILD